MQCIPIVTETLGGLGSACHLYYSPFGSNHSRQVWILGPFCLNEATFPKICDLSLVGQCMYRHPTIPPTLDGIAIQSFDVFFCVFFDICIVFFLLIAPALNPKKRKRYMSGSGFTFCIKLFERQFLFYSGRSLILVATVISFSASLIKRNPGAVRCMSRHCSTTLHTDDKLNIPSTESH